MKFSRTKNAREEESKRVKEVTLIVKKTEDPPQIKPPTLKEIMATHGITRDPSPLLYFSQIHQAPPPQGPQPITAYVVFQFLRRELNVDGFGPDNLE
ncbi:unnamed protein product [Arabidopsis thaliana]|nr:unnamed protein product [Arabidopsis thaliana]